MPHQAADLVSDARHAFWNAVRPAARAICSRSVLPALPFCPCGLCLSKNAAGLRAAVMSFEMLQVHVDA
eukprot:987393-Rhodomonas_salina.1